MDRFDNRLTRSLCRSTNPLCDKSQRESMGVFLTSMGRSRREGRPA